MIAMRNAKNRFIFYPDPLKFTPPVKQTILYQSCAAGEAKPIKVNNPATIQAAKKGDCEGKILTIVQFGNYRNFLPNSQYMFDIAFVTGSKFKYQGD